MTDVAINVRLPSVSPGHSASQVARAELLEDLGTVPTLRARERDLPAVGASKGPLTELVVSVSTSGGLAALVKIMRIWLDRDRRRSLKVVVETSENKTTYEISGEDVSVETLRDALEAAVRSQDANDSDSSLPRLDGRRGITPAGTAPLHGSRRSTLISAIDTQRIST